MAIELVLIEWLEQQLPQHGYRLWLPPRPIPGAHARAVSSAETSLLDSIRLQRVGGDRVQLTTSCRTSHYELCDPALLQRMLDWLLRQLNQQAEQHAAQLRADLQQALQRLDQQVKLWRVRRMVTTRLSEGDT